VLQNPPHFATQHLAGKLKKTNMLQTIEILGLVVLLGFTIRCNEKNSVDNPKSGLFSRSTIIVDGITRICDFYIPDNLGFSSVPLVFLLHGVDSNSDDLTSKGGFIAPYKVWMNIAEDEKFIIFYSNGTEESQIVLHEVFGESHLEPSIQEQP
jgi:poly(3-hydroxybutyrate) depolymerase